MANDENHKAELSKTLKRKMNNAVKQGFELLKKYCNEAEFESEQLSSFLVEYCDFLKMLNLKQLIYLARYFDIYCPEKWVAFIESFEDESLQAALKRENSLRNDFQDKCYQVSISNLHLKNANQDEHIVNLHIRIHRERSFAFDREQSFA